MVGHKHHLVRRYFDIETPLPTLPYSIFKLTFPNYSISQILAKYRKMIFSLLAAVFLASLTAAQNTVSNTILVFARDSASGYSATSGLNAYGIPYQLILVPQAGITLPTLNSSNTNGNYGGIIVLSEVAYSYPTGWASALTAAQWQQLYSYQTSFGVRMVRLDVYPTSEFGTWYLGHEFELSTSSDRTRNHHSNCWGWVLQHRSGATCQYQ